MVVATTAAIKQLCNGLKQFCSKFYCSANHGFTASSELRKFVFGAVSLWFFLFVYEISGATAERICARFTQKTCLVPCLEEFEGQGQGHQAQKLLFSALSAACVQFVW